MRCVAHRWCYSCRMAATITTTEGFVPPTWTRGDKLAKARKIAGYSQADLATALGVSRATIVRYEDEQTAPSLGTLVAWAVLCRVPYEWLTDEELPSAPGRYVRRNETEEQKDATVALAPARATPTRVTKKVASGSRTTAEQRKQDFGRSHATPSAAKTTRSRPLAAVPTSTSPARRFRGSNETQRAQKKHAA